MNSKLYPLALVIATTLVACPTVDPVVQNKPLIDPSPEARGTLTDLTGSGAGIAGTAQQLSNNVGAKFQQLIKDGNLGNVRLSSADNGLVRLQALFQTMQSGRLDAGNVRLQADQVSLLPTGDFDCSDATKPCVKTNSADFVLRFKTVTNVSGVITVDWDGSSIGAASAPVTLVGSSSGQNTYSSQLPTKLVAKLELNGVKFAEFNFAGTWQSVKSFEDRGGTVPYTYYAIGLSKLDASGFINDTDGKRLLDIKTLQYQFDDATTTVTSKVDASLTLNADKAAIKWDLSLKGRIDASAQYGFGVLLSTPKGFQPSGAASLTAILELNDKKYAAVLKADNWVYSTATPALLSADLLEGSAVSLEGKTASFKGTLGDANKNCIPGEGLNVTTKEGTQSFEKILTDKFNLRPCVQ